MKRVWCHISPMYMYVLTQRFSIKFILIEIERQTPKHRSANNASEA